MKYLFCIHIKLGKQGKGEPPPHVPLGTPERVVFALAANQVAIKRSRDFDQILKTSDPIL